MPRTSGVYTLPNPPFAAGTSISSSKMNANLNDIATAITDTVAADGQTPMTGALRLASGTALAPSVAFAGDTTSGFFLKSATVIGIALGGVLAFIASTAGLTTPGGISPFTPIGTIADFASSSSPPTGWYLCYGQAVSRSTYALLFAQLGTTYGAGDGSTTFNLPDCRGRALYNLDNQGGTTAGNITVAGGNYDGTVLGNSGGAQNQTLTTSTMVAHTHADSLSADSGHVHTNPVSSFQTSLITTTGGPVVVVNGFSGNSGSNTTGLTFNPVGVGSSNAFTILNPSIILNKMIFAGA